MTHPPASPLRWGILSTGAIARTFARGLKAADRCRLTAVASRDLGKADAFADEFAAEHRFGDYDELLASDACDAVYVATPHTLHARWAIRAAEAGKHVFLEKPAGLNRPEVEAVVEAARAHGVYFAEAFKERRHPVVHRVAELLRQRVIGEVRTIRCAFGFWVPSDADPDGRLLSPHLAGGGILDVGCYPANLVRLLAGAAAAEPVPFLHPDEVKGVAQLGPTGVDLAASAVLKFPTGVIAELSTGLQTAGNVGLRVFGELGEIACPDPWANGRDGGGAFTVTVKPARKDPTTEKIECPKSAFTLEAEAAAAEVLAGRVEPEPPGMTWGDSLSNAETLDRWRQGAGLTYPGETPAGFTGPLHGRPPAKAADAAMTYGTIDGLDKPISRLIMGCDNQPNFAHAAVMFDAWFEAGGNAFDTAWTYAKGLQERLLGDWLRTRGVRDDCVVIVKGCHPPFDTPDAIGWQLRESLDRLGLDKADLYILHRDNLDVPIGEWVDALNEQVDAGLLGPFGGSNWSLARVDEANAYALARGKRPMTLTSNNLSLARMLEPVWKGCVACSDPESIAWLTQRQVANFAWSSQARGWFVSRDAQAMQTGPNSWDDAGNRERRERAFELAEAYGVSAINVAAAYVLCQAFPSFALVGPRRLQEITTSLPALGLGLSPEELAWLDLRSDARPASLEAATATA